MGTEHLHKQIKRKETEKHRKGMQRSTEHRENIMIGDLRTYEFRLHINFFCLFRDPTKGDHDHGPSKDHRTIPAINVFQ